MRIPPFLVTLLVLLLLYVGAPAVAQPIAAPPAAASPAPVSEKASAATPVPAAVVAVDGGVRVRPKAAALRAAKKKRAAKAAALDGGLHIAMDKHGGAAVRNRTAKSVAVRALHALDTMREEEEKTKRRIARVKEAILRGDAAMALGELSRAEESTEAAKSAAEGFAEAEILETSDYVWRGLMSLGILILGALLVFFSAFFLRRLLTRSAGRAWVEVGAGFRWAYRIIVTSVTLCVLFFGTWLTVYFVWGMRVSPEKLFSVLAHPVFAFEGRPVTFVSMVLFLLTISFIILVSRSIRQLLERRLMPRFSSDVGMQQAFAAILHYVVVFVGLLISLEVLGVGASTVAIVAGVVGIGFGFGMQHIINNFLSGFVLFFERPIKVGDVVDVGGGSSSTEGKVVRIQARATTLVTRDGVTVVVPNADFIQGKVLNLTIPDSRMRTRIKVGVDYQSDMELVTSILYGVVGDNEKVLKDPPPRVRLVEFADSSLSMECLFWIDDIMGRDQIQSDLRFEVLRRFRAAGVLIPFPHRDTTLRPSPELLQLWSGKSQRDEDGE